MKSSSLFGSLRRAGFSFAFAALAASASMAAAEQTYPLKLHFNKGDKWSFDVDTAMKQKGQVLANGQLAQPIEQAFEQRRKGTIEVVNIDHGMPSEMKITYDAESANTGGAGQQVPPFPLAGHTVHVARKDGVVTSDLGNDVDAPTVQEVTHMLDPDTSIYPKEAVAVDQEWDGDTAAIAKAYQLGADDKVSIKCKLVGVHEVNGRQVADVGLTGSLLKHDQGFVETRITLEGTTHIDVQTGQATDSTMTGKIKMSGEQQQAGPDGTPVKIAVSADGDLQIHQTVRQLNAAAVADGPGFFPGPDPSPKPAPMPDNHVVRTGDGGPFSGSFKGDQVALELTSAGGQYAGTLTVGEKKYPVSAKADGEKLTGNFQSDGTKFDFTASLQGSTLTLVSEGSSYTLKKPAANPLVRPVPKNPLAQ